jgi:uncharacterized protein DUF397
MNGISWRMSSRSGSAGDNCVEVADTGGRVLVRDSKHPAAGQLAVSHASWKAFVDAVAGGDFDAS